MKTPTRVVLISLLCWGVGCAGSSGGITADHGLDEAVKPNVTLVYPFGFNASVVKVDAALFGDGEVSTAEREDLGRAVAAAVSRKLVEELAAAGIPARRADSSTNPAPDAMLVKGNFTNIDQGDQAARVAIGMGKGVERIEVRLKIEQVTADGVQLLTEEFHGTHGDKMPGMVVSMGVGAATGSVASSAAFAAGEKVLAESLGGLEAAVDNLVEHLVESTVAYYDRRGWSH